MKTKAYYITFFSVILAFSLLCIALEFLKLNKNVKYKSKRAESGWKDLISSYIENYDELGDEDYERLDVFDMKLKQVKIVGRIKASDEFNLQKIGWNFQEEKDESEIITDVVKMEDGKITNRPANLAETNLTGTSSYYQIYKDKQQDEDKRRHDEESYKLGKSKFAEDNVKQSVKKRPQKRRKLVRGFLNLYTWDNICGHGIASLKEFILFPSLPKFKKFVNQTAVYNINIKKSGARMFGFLKPEQTGLYRFGISSSGNSELWLSNDTNAKNKRKIAFVGSENERLSTKPGFFNQFHSQTSNEIHLQKGVDYLIEILYKHTAGTGRFEVAWLTPESTTFQVIPGKFLSAASGNASSVTAGVTNSSSVTSGVNNREDYQGIRVQMSTEGYNPMAFMDFGDFEKAFNVCDYEPSYYIAEKLVRFQGARNKNNTHFAEIFPPDNSNETLPLVKGQDIWWTKNSYGNDVIDNATAQHVRRMFTEALEKTYKDDFEVIKMLYLEKVEDKIKGSRYHLQMEVRDIYSGRHFEFSEYLYQPKGLDSLCLPRDFRWHKFADVYIIVPVKNSGRWALYLIKNLAAIISKTLDPHVHLIIVDYQTTDVDIEAALKQSVVVRYTIVRMSSGKDFNRADALQKGADVVLDPHSILFMCDLHLTMPATFIEIIRKHCIEGKMAFAPVVKRLKCGYYPNKPFGYWETLGFGLFAIYKSDFDRVGAMNVEEFKGWGGEDWELLDRVLESRIEVERLKIHSFYHFFHPAYGSEFSRSNA